MAIGNGIWLRFNKKGTLISKITNGHTIRQHGSFTLFFTFEDESIITGKSLYVGFQKPGEIEPTFWPADNENQYTFKKYKANEITYGLEDGKTYNAFKLEVPTSLAITNKYGDLTLVSKICDSSYQEYEGELSATSDYVGYYVLVGTTYTEVTASNKDTLNITPGTTKAYESVTTTVLQGSVQLYIEPTYGDNSGTSDISNSQYENLIEEIGKKLNKKDGTATNLTVSSGTLDPSVKVGSTEGNTVVGKKVDDLENYYNKTAADDRFLNNDGDTATDLTISSGTISSNVKIGADSENTAIGLKDLSTAISNLTADITSQNSPFSVLVSEAELEQNNEKFVQISGEDTIDPDENILHITSSELAEKATGDEDGVNIKQYYAKKTELPTVNDAILTIQKNGTSLGTFSANASSNETINITVPTSASDVNALADNVKYANNISLSINNNTFVITAQLKDQDGNNLGSASTIDLPLESVVVSGSYDSTNKKIVLTLQSGSTVEVGVSDLVSGLVPDSRTINSKALSSNITLTASDVGALPSDTVVPTITDSVTQDSTAALTSGGAYTALSGKQDTLTAGSNISISNNVISSTPVTITSIVRNSGSDTSTTYAYTVNFSNNTSISMAIPKPTVATGSDGVITIEV